MSYPQSTIGAEELAQRLGLTVEAVGELAREQRLPFTVGSCGMFIRARDLPAWLATAQRYRNRK
jgi:hypothetical protein